MVARGLSRSTGNSIHHRDAIVCAYAGAGAVRPYRLQESCWKRGKINSTGRCIPFGARSLQPPSQTERNLFRQRKWRSGCDQSGPSGDEFLLDQAHRWISSLFERSSHKKLVHRLPSPDLRTVPATVTSSGR
ncbi:membrane protein [Anopheles sinensis]|uniref:Membrane protein n=1 Tax=Anopheles sinensis TaxID=74873 RepID=A0A084WC22_ANOSI|nr:membrane protein [Anopheles sinensis]